MSGACSRKLGISVQSEESEMKSTGFYTPNDTPVNCSNPAGAFSFVRGRDNILAKRRLGTVSDHFVVFIVIGVGLSTGQRYVVT
jgi:hypothetical protein